MGAKNVLRTHTCTLTRSKLKKFLVDYEIPTEFKVMLPKTNGGLVQLVPQPLSRQVLADLRQKDTIVPKEYSELLSKANKLDKKTGTDIQEKDKKKAKNKQIRARSGKDQVKSKSKVIHMKKIQLEGLKLPNLKLYCKRKRQGSKLQRRQRLHSKMAFRNVMFATDDEEMSILPKDPSNEFEQLIENSAELEGSLRKLATSGSFPRIVRKKFAKAKIESSSYLVISNDDDDDEGFFEASELKTDVDCCLLISKITPLAWRGYLDNQYKMELLDLHDRYYARQDVVDNVVNRRARELLKMVEQMKGESMIDFDKNPTVIVLRQKIMSLLAEIMEHKSSLDMMLLESQKWAGYQENLMTLDSKVSALEVEKALVQQRIYQVQNDLAATIFSFLSAATADPSASVEALLSKKPKSFHCPTPTKTRAPSKLNSPSPALSKTSAPSSAPSMKLVSPPHEA
ncbi:hypothetical protein Tco_0751566 [Tanacetum coccineum]|uniref:Uncharacterized protein n=1 Tax=Tanacetum coccineum TaxID=301880 RepID=A0ABQ4Z5E7_9ASTR